MDKPTRVKYKLAPTGLYVSTQVFLGNEGTLLYSTINPTTSEVSVHSSGSQGLIEVVPYTSFPKAKLQAKALLKKYGVSFFEEVRTKKAS